jgi:hypothetical protein
MPRKPAVRKKPTALWPYHHCTIASTARRRRSPSRTSTSDTGSASAVDDVQHGDGDDEGGEEPVGHVDVLDAALDDGAEEHDA